VSERRVVYRLQPDGRWIASAQGRPRCRAGGHTLRVARRRLRTVLTEKVGEEARRLCFAEDVRLPDGARRLVVAHWKARRAVEARRRRAEDATRAAVAALIAIGLSPRDACDLLGLSPATLAGLRRRAR
jgi:hypothetical protein